jgi:transposase
VCESLDLSAIYDVYTEERGFPPYHPAMMVSLLLYAYTQGIYSSRRIARAAIERFDFAAVTGMQRPDHRTVSDFRKRHLEALGGLFVQVLQLCARAGLVKLGHVALDGTKIQANASKRKAMSYDRMKQREKELTAKIEDWFRKAEQEDSDDDGEFGDASGDELPEWVANDKQRLEKIKKAKAELQAEAKEEAKKMLAANDGRRKDFSHKWFKRDGTPKPKAQRNFTDPESRIMLGPNGFVQGYNALAGVDAESQVIVTQTLTNEQNDGGELKTLLVGVKANTGRQAKEISADSNFCSEKNLAECARRKIRAFIAPGRQLHGKPVPDEGRRPTPGSRVAAMLTTLARGGYRSRYRLRKQTIEPVFGQIKEPRGFRRFLLRGLAKVKNEWSLICTAHNLLKLAAV